MDTFDSDKTKTIDSKWNKAGLRELSHPLLLDGESREREKTAYLTHRLQDSMLREWDGIFY